MALGPDETDIFPPHFEAEPDPDPIAAGATAASRSATPISARRIDRTYSARGELVK